MLSYNPILLQPPAASSMASKKKKEDKEEQSFSKRVKKILTDLSDHKQKRPQGIKAVEKPHQDRDQEHEEVGSAKDRLLAIILAEKASALKNEASSSSAAVVVTSCSLEEDSSCASSETTTCSGGGGQKHGLIKRSFAGLRRSFRKTTSSFLKKNTAADLSHDSGLGEDSDTSHNRSSPLTPILRNSLVLGASAASSNLKHVMIREPSLRHLPSAKLRNSFPGAAGQKPILVRLETAKHRHYRYSYHADNLTGDVGPQWGSLYFAASLEVRTRLPELNCDSRRSAMCDLVFCNDGRAIQDKLMVMETDEVDETIGMLYKILFVDWLPTGSEPVSPQLAIILHCVQKFLVIVVDVCPELEANDRRRLSICSRGLLRQCEDAKYSPVAECLARTRTLYIQVWCAILCVPFALESTSPSL